MMVSLSIRHSYRLGPFYICLMAFGWFSSAQLPLLVCRRRLCIGNRHQQGSVPVSRNLYLTLYAFGHGRDEASKPVSHREVHPVQKRSDHVATVANAFPSIFHSSFIYASTLILRPLLHAHGLQTHQCTLIRSPPQSRDATQNSPRESLNPVGWTDTEKVKIGTSCETSMLYPVLYNIGSFELHG